MTRSLVRRVTFLHILGISRPRVLQTARTTDP